MIEIPYVSQLGIGASEFGADCGQACVLMLLRAAGTPGAASLTVDALSREVGGNYTSSDELVDLLTRHGLQARALYLGNAVMAKMRGDIVLVQYSQLRQRVDQAFTGFHWLVYLGRAGTDVIVHDPDNYGTSGAGLAYRAADFDAAFAHTTVRATLPTPQEVIATMPQQATIKAGYSRNARYEPTITSRDLGNIEEGSVLQIDHTETSTDPRAPGTWVYCSTVQRPGDENLLQGVWVWDGGAIGEGAPPTTTPPVVVTPPPVVPASTPRHVLGLHLIHSLQEADRAYAAGCRGFVGMDGKVWARNFAAGHPDAIVVYRKWVSGGLPDPGTMVTQLEVAADDPPNLRYVGTNENDNIGGDKDPAVLRVRARWDIEVAKRMRAIGSKAMYLAGSWGHGCPDFTNPDICRAIQEEYAPAYNGGLIGWDGHNYTMGKRRPEHPVPVSPIYGPEWFERRWEFLFTRCGFDPRVRAVYSTESGVEAAAGGFSWAGYSQQQMREWIDDYLAIVTAPLVIGGVSHPSPHVFSAIFQFGENSSWAGYDVRGYLDTFAGAWR